MFVTLKIIIKQLNIPIFIPYLLPADLMMENLTIEIFLIYGKDVAIICFSILLLMKVLNFSNIQNASMLLCWRNTKGNAWEELC